MKIVLATFGSLGDMHPMNALGIELRRRGHVVAFAAMEFYREKSKRFSLNFARCARISTRIIKNSPAI